MKAGIEFRLSPIGAYLVGGAIFLVFVVLIVLIVRDDQTEVDLDDQICLQSYKHPFEEPECFNIVELYNKNW